MVEKGLFLLNQLGRLGFILPHKFFNAAYGEPLRSLISKGKHLGEIVHFGNQQVFQDATTYTCLMFLDKSGNSEFKFSKINSLEEWRVDKKAKIGKISTKNIDSNEWKFQIGAVGDLLNTLDKQTQKLGDVAEKIFVGLQTSADNIYVLKTVKEKKNTVLLYSKSLGEEVEIEKGFLRPFLMGKDVHRYENPSPENYVIFPYMVSGTKANLMTVKHIKENLPLAWQYLVRNKKELENREKGKMKHEKFYAYIYPKNLALFHLPKIMTPEIALGGQMSFDDKGVAHTTKVYSFIFKKEIEENFKYWLGLLNSKILWFFLSNTGYALRGGYFTFKTNYLKPFPVKRIDFMKKTEKVSHDKMVDLVEQILDLNKKLDSEKTAQDKTHLQRRIDTTDREIDQLVYKLYDLTEEEIKIVEENTQ